MRPVRGEDGLPVARIAVLTIAPGRGYSWRMTRGGPGDATRSFGWPSGGRTRTGAWSRTLFRQSAATPGVDGARAVAIAALAAPAPLPQVKLSPLARLPHR